MTSSDTTVGATANGVYHLNSDKQTTTTSTGAAEYTTTGNFTNEASEDYEYEFENNVHSEYDTAGNPTHTGEGSGYSLYTGDWNVTVGTTYRGRNSPTSTFNTSSTTKTATDNYQAGEDWEYILSQDGTVTDDIDQHGHYEGEYHARTEGSGLSTPTFDDFSYSEDEWSGHSFGDWLGQTAGGRAGGNTSNFQPASIDPSGRDQLNPGVVNAATDPRSGASRPYQFPPSGLNGATIRDLHNRLDYDKAHGGENQAYLEAELAKARQSGLHARDNDGYNLSAPAGVSAPSFAVGFIPVIGNGMNAAYHLDRGELGWAAFYGGMAITDVFLVKSLATSVGKALLSGAGKEAAELAGTGTAKNAANALRKDVVEECLSGITCFVAGTEVLLGDRQTKVDIEDIRVGQRVATDGGVANSEDGQTVAADPNATNVNPATWRLVTIETDDGDWQVQTLVPLNWLQQRHAETGGAIYLSSVTDLAEMGVTGSLIGTITSIGDCPPIESGHGRVVLTTVSHMNNFVFSLTLTDSTGVDDVIGITGYHKIFTEGRGWIAAQDLHIGETVRTSQGPATVSLLVEEPGSYRVYNMTVEADHVYYVGELQALVHNACSTTSGENAAAALGRKAHEAYADAMEVMGYTVREALSNGKIPDAYRLIKDAAGHVIGAEVFELKPNHANAMRKGLAQLDGYARQIAHENDLLLDSVMRFLVVY